MFTVKEDEPSFSLFLDGVIEWENTNISSTVLFIF